MTAFYKRCNKLIELLKNSGLTIAAAESCTGGAFMHALVKVAKASEVFPGGIVSYSEDAKVNLVGVKRETIEQFGVVSREVAVQMAEGSRKKLCANIGVGITGYAGPGGARVGEIHMAIDFNGELTHMQEDYAHLSKISRDSVINAAVAHLVESLIKMLGKHEKV